MNGGLVYAVLFLLALAPGLPAGFAVFGRQHPAGWIAGGAIGYALTSLALWVPIRLGVASGTAFVAAWVAVGLLAFAASLGRQLPLVPLRAWRRHDTVSWASVLLITAVLAIPPIVKAGATDAEGNRYYRAYFTADFAWHTALTAEMAKFSMPPRNPYLAPRPMHYYWTYFVLPASVSATGPRPVRNVELCLKANAIGTALLFVSAIFIAAWTAVPHALAVGLSVALAIVASSGEGTYALSSLWRAGAPIDAVKDLNIDAITSWWFSALRVDGLQRCFWWVPQHSMAYALGLIAFAIVNAAGSGRSLAAITIAGIALGGAALMNPFVGGVFSLAWGIAVVLDALGKPHAIARIARHGAAAVPVVLAIAWCAANSMVEGAGGALRFGWLDEARNHPIAGLVLSLGPAILPAIVGVAATASLRVSRSALALAMLSLGALYLLRLSVDLSWVGFRAGQMFLVAVPALAARGFIGEGRWRKVATSAAVIALVAGAPTTAIDAYNAQDITNFSESPNGPWTVVVTRAEVDALEWLRRATPADAIVQMDPNARDRKTWSLLPSLAQRRMAAGLPISLLAVPEYHERAKSVRQMYETADAEQAWRIARRLRIEYIYIDRVERESYSLGTAKFKTAPERFATAFENAEVNIYRVQ